MQTITLIGAGLSGSLLAIYLAKRGFQVEVYEKRSDMRKMPVEAGRSINLALSSRGIRALRAIGIADEVLRYAIPMYGRMLHSVEGALTYVPYGKDTSEYINSISRAGLNQALLELADSFPNVNFRFHQALESVNLAKETLTFRDTQTQEKTEISSALTIGTDGAGSVLRQGLSMLPEFQESVEFLAHGYKELTIPALPSGGFQAEKNALHIWPRGTYMLIALPNPDGSFTCTLFFPNEGEISFAGLDTASKVEAFFKEKFGDAVAIMPDLIQDFLHNPVGLLGTVKCFPWHYQDKFLLLGDSAHAVVPFYGQGMNCSFEDCIVLDECIEKFGTDWADVFATYQNLRKINTDAIADLAVENFYEMRDGTANPAFLRVRQLENLLENQYHDYHSKYSMVTFHPEIPYHIAQKRGNLQNELLLEICANINSIEELEIAAVYQKLSAVVSKCHITSDF
jgi:kynurenine 3-monooxygenase